MQITRHTDFALRLLMYVAVCQDRSTIAEAADALKVSRHHLVKIANRLGELGHLDLVRGNSGGISLGRDPGEINVGQVFRELENSMLVECFDPSTSECVFSVGCVLHTTLQSAMDAFLEQLDQVTLEDLVRKRRSVRGMVGLDARGHRG